MQAECHGAVGHRHVQPGGAREPSNDGQTIDRQRAHADPVIEDIGILQPANHTLGPTQQYRRPAPQVRRHMLMTTVLPIFEVPLGSWLVWIPDPQALLPSVRPSGGLHRLLTTYLYSLQRERLPPLQCRYTDGLYASANDDGRQLRPNAIAASSR